MSLIRDDRPQQPQGLFAQMPVPITAGNMLPPGSVVPPGSIVGANGQIMTSNAPVYGQSVPYNPQYPYPPYPPCAQNVCPNQANNNNAPRPPGCGNCPACRARRT